MRSPRIVFAGTPEFALASLQALVDAKLTPVAVYTQPDRPAGRGRKIKSSPVKKYAEQCGISVAQPVSLRDASALTELQDLQPDLMIVAAYGLILPQDVLDVPRRGCLNVHASLLPRWRGAAPIQAAILANDENSGVTLMGMEAGLDTGPMYAKRAVSIGSDETAGELQQRLARLGGELLVDKVAAIINGDIAAQPQDDSLATYAAKISNTDAMLDWSLPADDLQRRVRAYNPAPGAFFFANGDAEKGARIKVWKATVVPEVDAAPGEIARFDADAIVLACGKGGLRLDELQLAGKTRASAREFVTQIDLRS